MGSEKPLSDINFFICSTYVDLRTHREAVINSLRSHAGVINAQEFFGARDQRPLATCLEEVDKADVFLLFLGHRYGTSEPESRKSFVECEYERAVARLLPRFAYLMHESHPIPFAHVSLDDDAAKLKAFKDRVTKDLTVDFFTTPDDLAKKVYADLVRRLPEKGFKLGLDKASEGLPTAGDVLKEFNLLPRLHHGRQLELRVKFKGCERASHDACEAFGFDYGSAIERRFDVVDQSLRDIIGPLGMFAEDESALELMKFPNGRTIDAVAKTIQGEYSRTEAIYGFQLEPHPYLAHGGLGVPIEGRRRVVIDHRVSKSLMCGLQFIEGVIA